MSLFYSSACFSKLFQDSLFKICLFWISLLSISKKINTEHWEWSSFGRVLVQPAQSRGFGPQGHNRVHWCEPLIPAREGWRLGAEEFKIFLSFLSNPRQAWTPRTLSPKQKYDCMCLLVILSLNLIWLSLSKI